MAKAKETELVDIEVEVTAETEKAYRMYDGKTYAWVPKSQVTYDKETKTVTMPEWLATDKGFV